jgi:uncharacterized membrane protein
MDGEFLKEIVHLVLRWIHVVAGVIWIGHLYFFNWVNGHVAKTYDADTKKKVVPELMPRALYWFRWGAAYTWVSGVLLLGFVYYMERSFMGVDAGGSVGMAIARAFSVIIILPALYDYLWRTAFKGKEQVGVIVTSLVVAGVTWYLASFLPGRTAFIHLGAMFGTTMFMNVWMRIWPNQRKIIAAIKEGKGPDADLVALAGLRSKHNTYMSVPLIFTMVSNHFPGVYGASAGGMAIGWVLLLVIVAVGWLSTKWMYVKSGKPEAAKF